FFKQKTAYEITRWTGVQTCALPIFGSSALSCVGFTINAVLAMHFLTYHVRITSQLSTVYFAAFYGGSLAGVAAWVRLTRIVEKRSEERRVGKECSTRRLG